MPNNHSCSNCGKSLANKKSHARSCSGACRAKTWRALQAKPISVKLSFSKTQFAAIKREANIQELLVNQFIINKALNLSSTQQLQL